MDRLLVYGAYGYSGRLVVREAIKRGGAPVVGGRNRRRVVELADDFGLEGQVFGLGADSLPDTLSNFDAVLNCAGPFENTAAPLVAACLESETDYLDLTGEIGVFHRLRHIDERAEAAGVTLLPGVGFEVVVTDCLAAFLRSQLPTANTLKIAIANFGSLSRGTTKTAIRHSGKGGVVRRNGRLLRVPTAHDVHEFDFGDGPEPAVSVPLGDVVTAHHSTGIDTVTTYVAAPRSAVAVVRLCRPLEGLLSTSPVTRILEGAADRFVTGPDDPELTTGEVAVAAEVTDGERTAKARLHTPTVYGITAEAAVCAARRVLDGVAECGFQTPSTAFGAEFVLDLEGVRREGVKPPTATDDSVNGVSNGR